MGKATSKKDMGNIDRVELLEIAICECLEQQHVLNGCLDHSGLSQIDAETLQKALIPLEHELRDIDAEQFLNLTRTSRGPTIHDGISVKAIHSEIKPPQTDAVRYLKVVEAESYSIGVFIFPPNMRMPIHDHPGMVRIRLHGRRDSLTTVSQVVYSRILYGELQRLRLDLNPNDRMSNAHDGRSAYLHAPDRLQAPDVTVLFPFQGNLHEFVSGPEGAAVLDVLLPPYNDDDRDCTYYEIQGDQRPGLCRVVPCPMDENFSCLTGTYAKWNC